MDRQFEYVAVAVPVAEKGQRRDDVITAQMNEVAAHGWRLHSVLPGGQFGGGHLLFERPKP